MRSATFILAVMAGLAVASPSPANKLARAPGSSKKPDCGPKEAACCSKNNEFDNLFCLNCLFFFIPIPVPTEVDADDSDSDTSEVTACEIDDAVLCCDSIAVCGPMCTCSLNVKLMKIYVEWVRGVVRILLQVRSTFCGWHSTRRLRWRLQLY